VNGGFTWIVGGVLAAVALVLWGAGSIEAMTVVYAAIGFVLASSVGRWMSTPQDKQWLPMVVSVAFVVKLLASVARYTVLVEVYGGRGDARGYHGAGNQLVSVWRSFEIPQMSIGTEFVNAVTAFLYVPYVPTMLGGFFLFATIAFFGQLLMYAAFRKCAKPGTLGWYAAVMLFLPTIVYWPSSIGKESLMYLFIGTAVFGAAYLLYDYRLRWAVLFGLGTAGAAAIRPHIAVLLVVSLAVALVFGESGARRIERGRKILVVGVVGVLLVGFTVVAATQFNIDLSAGLDSSRGVERVLGNVEESTGKGGSATTGTAVTSPLEFPSGFVKVLFRPFPYEAGNAQSLASSIEGLLLLGFLLWRAIPILKNGWRIRQHPYLIFALVFMVGFIIAFSAFNNFGLLARQRSQVIPFFLALLIGLGWSSDTEDVGSDEELVDGSPQTVSS